MSSGFVSSNELDEEKKKRQEEWEKVRKPEDPLSAPEPEVCNKTLFEQLRDNKDAKDAEKAEAKKFKNMIRGIDEGESEFLSSFFDAKAEMEKQKEKEELELLKQMEKAKTQVVQEAPSITASIPVASSGVKSKQASLLSSAIKRKSDNAEGPSAQKISKNQKTEEVIHTNPSALQVIGVIPGIGSYDASSDSASSCSSDDEGILPVLQTTRPEKPTAEHS
ncbi:unnamed protein product [Auanema sp. JU1783]|nr:unnamed protein product [Auanema sp. JU1783]